MPAVVDDQICGVALATISRADFHTALAPASDEGKYEQKNSILVSLREGPEAVIRQAVELGCGVGKMFECQFELNLRCGIGFVHPICKGMEQKVSELMCQTLEFIHNSFRTLPIGSFVQLLIDAESYKNFS